MGMFDYVHISIENLPVNEFEIAILMSSKEKGFQTKSFGCYLDNIKIEDDGSLVGAATNDPDFDFYTLIGEHWIQFEAHVRDGRVYEIINTQTGQKTSL